jgi:hypothetical protein
MEPGPPKEFTEMGIEFLEASSEAWRTRVDNVTINHINPDAASLYARDQNIQRESSLLLPNAQRHVGNYNTQTSLQMSKLVANWEAATQLGIVGVPTPKTLDVETKSAKASRLKRELAFNNKKAGATKSKAAAGAAAKGTGGGGRGPSSTGANAPGSTTAAPHGGSPTRLPAASASAAAAPRGQGA